MASLYANRADAQGVSAIPTEYGGVRFRSRTEARWAMFFDHLRIRWDYEREAYALPSGNYLPDFWLPEVRGGMWVEIKGQFPTDVEQELMLELVQHTGHDGAVLHGQLPRVVGCDGSDNMWHLEWTLTRPDGSIDHPYAWCVCCCCGKVGFEFEARGARVCGTRCCAHDKCYTGDNARIAKAYREVSLHHFWDPR